MDIYTCGLRDQIPSRLSYSHTQSEAEAVRAVYLYGCTQHSKKHKNESHKTHDANATLVVEPIAVRLRVGRLRRVGQGERARRRCPRAEQQARRDEEVAAW